MFYFNYRKYYKQMPLVLYKMKSTSNNEILDAEYEDYLEQQAHVKPITLEMMRSRFRAFPEPDKLDASHFRKRMKDRSPSTIKAEVELARRFLKHSGRDSAILDRDVLKLPRVEDSVTVEDLYSKEDLTAIFKACLNTRDRAMLEVLYESASRAGELISMTWENTAFNGDNTATIIIKGKTGTRKVPLYESVPALVAWKNVHLTGKGPVWVALRSPHRQIGTRQLYETVLRAIERAELKRDVKRIVHNFRHTRATELVRRGVRGQVLSKLMGWTKKSNMEAIYVHLSTEDVTNEVHSKVFGIASKRAEPKPLLESTTCPRCKAKNDNHARMCSECNMPLSNDAIMKALNEQGKKDDRTEALEARIEILERLLYSSFAQGDQIEIKLSPELVKELEDIFGAKWQDRAREELFTYILGSKEKEASSIKQKKKESSTVKEKKSSTDKDSKCGHACGNY